MSQTTTVMLGSTLYHVPKLNIGQLRQVTRIFGGPAEDISFDVLKVALARATPAVENVEELEAGLDQISTAVSAILLHSGLQRQADQKNPRTRKEPAG